VRSRGGTSSHAWVSGLEPHAMAVTLEQVERAITDVLSGGQRYTLSDGTAVDRANLEVLQNMRRELTQEAQQTAAGQGMFVPVSFGRPG